MKAEMVQQLCASGFAVTARCSRHTPDAPTETLYMRRASRKILVSFRNSVAEASEARKQTLKDNMTEIRRSQCSKPETLYK